ncbi:MAG: peptide-methionine (S)-S-oxide reductase, partial [bacterium]
DNPTYHRLGNHTEALQVDFDPDQLSYKDLLYEVLRRQDPFNNIGSTQYRNAIWYHSKHQYETLCNQLEQNFDVTPDSPSLETVISPAETFHRAENYHQKYYLRKFESYMQLFEDLTPREFTDSTRAARLNGILAGKASDTNTVNLDELNLPEALEQDLIARVS